MTKTFTYILLSFLLVPAVHAADLPEKLRGSVLGLSLSTNSQSSKPEALEDPGREAKTSPTLKSGERLLQPKIDNLSDDNCDHFEDFLSV